MPPESLDEDAFRADLAEILADLARTRMPFGRFRNRFLYDLPFEYLAWFRDRGEGFPSGRLGELMAFVYQIKADGAESIFGPLRRGRQGPP